MHKGAREKGEGALGVKYETEKIGSEKRQMEKRLVRDKREGERERGETGRGGKDYQRVIIRKEQADRLDGVCRACEKSIDSPVFHCAKRVNSNESPPPSPPSPDTLVTRHRLIQTIHSII